MSQENRQVFLLPDLGEGLTEAELLNWLVAVGDEIRVDQPIAEVETAKSMVEVPSPFAGTVAELHGEAGQTMDVGKPLISVDRVAAVSGAAADVPAAETPAPDAGPKAEHDSAETYRDEERAGTKPPAEAEEPTGSGNVLIGYGTPEGGGKGRRRARKSGAAAATTVVPEQEESAPEPSQRAARVVSPLVRKLARDSGVKIATLTGSGQDGLILRGDVEAALSGSTSGSPESAGHAASFAASTAAAVSGEVDEKSGLGVSKRTPIKGLRKTVATNLTRSRAEIPEATVWVDVDATALLDMRADLKKRTPDSVPGLLAFIARFVTAGLQKYPELNTRIASTGDGQEIVSFDGVNLGFAAQTDRGLMVPSVRNAEKMSARELDAEIRRLTAVAREGKASPAELTSGTFTLNNYGVFGVDGSAAIINYPEVAILGVGRIIDKPWVVNGELAVRKVTELTLAFDHRVCDGGTAGGFLRYVADAIESPGSVLADL
ncbi:dihydrolipoamide acetyltransferase family protein [Arthrobacter roseus]|uniref:dihydrolipoamide acetyltransferase family protein n=1 Tax=Arthrobacter roseus TaxID=136274 RepID=UPI0019628943|nr:dihydrolipoamide acetyltransferase family protein [Arthrobacter roseus]MBM7849460.1 pyruvate dehydrogenase E2 component (dihydrolipoamide acetyltransferase) [Arthrobacter roseus]